MVRISSKIFVLLFFLFFNLWPGLAEEWRERMDSLIYTPKFFGPNAFPIPDLNSGKINLLYEAEVRYEVHQARGDNTSDIYLRASVPFGKKAMVEVSGVVREYYRTSDDIRLERHAANNTPANGDPCYGDVTFITTFQLLESEKWLDATFSLGLKTAGGNMLVDARYTDAASYWINVNAGKDIVRSENKDRYLRIVGMGGFYCYMTNSKVHRQNDAWMAGGGLKSRLRNVCWDADLRGFAGYWHEGDQPLLFHTRLQYNYKHHSFYFRYQYGVHDYLYRTYSGGYIFSF